MTAAALHDRLLLLLAGLAFDALFGDMPAVFAVLPHPVVLAGRAVAFFDRKLNRPQRGATQRRLRGAITVVVLVGAAAAIGWVAQAILQSGILGAAVEAVAVGTLLAQQSLYRHVAAVETALRRGGVSAGRAAVSHIVGRDPSRLDAAGVARAAIESLAENFSDAVVAPAFWFLLLGLPGLCAYKTANTLDSMIGHRSPRHLAFGWAAARFDDVANLAPARLSGLLLAGAAAFAARARSGRAAVVMLRDARKHASPNAGWPEAAMAGALGLALAGPRHYADGLVNDPWLGDGTPQATAADVARALQLCRLAGLLLAGLVAGAWLAAHVSRLG
ncbi:MAG TPA: adenosylcobinamide-phosphate synthase CbiB [Stellaceae bacterium]|nr:adenosylcobinamide-phosphate synthase CbiB [Stellaceae bacterium]